MEGKFFFGESEISIEQFCSSLVTSIILLLHDVALQVVFLIQYIGCNILNGKCRDKVIGMEGSFVHFEMKPTMLS